MCSGSIDLLAAVNISDRRQPGVTRVEGVCTSTYNSQRLYITREGGYRVNPEASLKIPTETLFERQFCLNYTLT